MGVGMRGLFAANYLFVFMTEVSTTPFEELWYYEDAHFPQHVHFSPEGRASRLLTL